MRQLDHSKLKLPGPQHLWNPALRRRQWRAEPVTQEKGPRSWLRLVPHWSDEFMMHLRGFFFGHFEKTHTGDPHFDCFFQNTLLWLTSKRPATQLFEPANASKKHSFGARTKSRRQWALPAPPSAARRFSHRLFAWNERRPRQADMDSPWYKGNSLDSSFLVIKVIKTAKSLFFIFYFLDFVQPAFKMRLV